MSKVFVDTSAFFALLCATDEQHGRARSAFDRLKEARAPLVTSSCVLVETYALLDRRLGREASARFHEDFEPLLEILWIGPDLHEEAMKAFLAGPRHISYVDASSFACMRGAGLDRVWAMDRHFEEAGFETVP